ncbi:MAG: DNA polymerase III subunit delta' [Desulfofustis sp.]|jgi:DNA polymerase-3 subunit delta'|nr:DNA polymerase III subunit delta' [Desulfofustis sp.]
MSVNRLSLSVLQGQEKAKRLLERIFVSQRLAHAYLFRGPDGVGKRFCALLVAARLNCRRPTEIGACGECLSCRKYLSGNHPDFITVSPDGGTIKIDTIRELCRSLAYPPYESPVRTVVLEDVHTLRSEAANSLLKTLEEPPEHNVLILTAESSREVLPTILSRCQIIPFHPLSSAQTTLVLRQQEPEISDSEAESLAAIAGGSPGLALLLRRQGIIEVWRDLVSLLTETAGDSADSVAALLQTAERIAALKQYLPLLLDLLRFRVGDQATERSSRAGLSRSESVRARLAAIDRAERRLARNCNRSLVCEVLLFDLQSLEPRVSL